MDKFVRGERGSLSVEFAPRANSVTELSPVEELRLRGPNGINAADNLQTYTNNYISLQVEQTIVQTEARRRREVEESLMRDLGAVPAPGRPFTAPMPKERYDLEIVPEIERRLQQDNERLYERIRRDAEEMERETARRSLERLERRHERNQEMSLGRRRDD